MKEIRIRVKDGEIVVPKIGKKSISHQGGEDDIYSFFQISADGNNVKQVTPLTYYSEINRCNDFFSYTFENAIPVTKEEWNTLVKRMANHFLRDNLIK